VSQTNHLAPKVLTKDQKSKIGEARLKGNMEGRLYYTGNYPTALFEFPEINAWSENVIDRASQPFTYIM